MRTFDLLVAAFALLQLARYARGALLALVPSVRISGGPAPTDGSTPERSTGAELERLGFVPVGSLLARARVGGFAREASVYASAARGAFADVLPARRGGAPRVEFFTPFANGAVVVTANERVAAVSTARAQVGGLPAAPLEAVLAAHEKALARLSPSHGDPVVGQDIQSRVSAAHVWYSGEGRRALRRAHSMSLLIAMIALALLASSLNILLRGAGAR